MQWGLTNESCSGVALGRGPYTPHERKSWKFHGMIVYCLRWCIAYGDPGADLSATICTATNADMNLHLMDSYTVSHLTDFVISAFLFVQASICTNVQTTYKRSTNSSIRLMQPTAKHWSSCLSNKFSIRWCLAHRFWSYFVWEFYIWNVAPSSFRGVLLDKFEFLDLPRARCFSSSNCTR